MSSKTTRILLLVGVAAAAALVAALGVLAFGGGKSGTASKEEYQRTVANARDRVDYAYAQITRSTSLDDAADRMDQASAAVGSVANDIDGAAVAPGYEDLNAKLAESLHTFSDALANSADQFRDPAFQQALGGFNSFGLEEWDKVNAVLSEMQKKGLEVKLLGRH